MSRIKCDFGKLIILKLSLITLVACLVPSYAHAFEALGDIVVEPERCSVKTQFEMYVGEMTYETTLSRSPKKCQLAISKISISARSKDGWIAYLTNYHHSIITAAYHRKIIPMTELYLFMELATWGKIQLADGCFSWAEVPSGELKYAQYDACYKSKKYNGKLPSAEQATELMLAFMEIGWKLYPEGSYGHEYIPEVDAYGYEVFGRTDSLMEIRTRPYRQQLFYEFTKLYFPKSIIAYSASLARINQGHIASLSNLGTILSASHSYAYSHYDKNHVEDQDDKPVYDFTELMIASSLGIADATAQNLIDLENVWLSKKSSLTRASHLCEGVAHPELPLDKRIFREGQCLYRRLNNASLVASGLVRNIASAKKGDLKRIQIIYAMAASMTSLIPDYGTLANVLASGIVTHRTQRMEAEVNAYEAERKEKMRQDFCDAVAQVANKKNVNHHVLTTIQNAFEIKLQ